ncbi:MAG TPA: hypothetical protein DCP20_10790 [Coriobacteriia bacterium]|nr:hypothetical protein [Coriobacteriia bacterium]
MGSVLDEVFRRIGPVHASALRWLAVREGRVAKRPWSKNLLTEPDVPDVKLTARRGIHVPAGWDVALSVALTQSSQYRDGDLELQDDGTWILLLRAHAGADGIGLESPWNRGLYECLRQRIPVALFMPVKSSDYRWLGLAFVDDYDDITRTFLLHGPVNAASPSETWGTVVDLQPNTHAPSWLLDDSDPITWQDERISRPGVGVVRESQGRFRQLLLDAYADTCAITQYDARPALDGAHILPFMGRSSDTARNGLLLRSDVHRLFDRFLLSVDTAEMTCVVSTKLQHTRYSELDGVPLTLPQNERFRPSVRHLELHHERFVQVEEP